MAISDEDIDELLGNANIKTQDDLFGKDGILKQLSKRLMERLLEAEMTNHLGQHKYAIAGHNSGNSRNGKTTKVVTSTNNRNNHKNPTHINKKHNYSYQTFNKSLIKGYNTP